MTLSPARPLLAACAAGLFAAGCGPTDAGVVYTEPDAAVAETAPASDPAAGTAPEDAAAPAVDPAAAVLADAGTRETGPVRPIPPIPPVPGEDFDGTLAGNADGGDDGDEEFVGGFAAPAEALDAPAIENDADGGARELELRVPVKSFPPTGDGNRVRVGFDDLDLLKVLNAEPVPPDVIDHLPDWLAGLDGKPVSLRGFMYPTYADPVKSFVLARDNQICCFGRNPKPYDLVSVKLAAGNESAYIQNRPFDVVGTFHLDPIHDGESWLRLYRIDDARVVE